MTSPTPDGTSANHDSPDSDSTRSDTPHGTSPQRTSLIRETGIGYFPIALLARLPFAMMVVGVLTLVVSARDSVALGGITSAMTGLGTALFGPLLGAAADRFGQRPVLLISGVINSALLAVMAWLAFSPVPDAAIFATAFTIGATMPQVAPMSRSRLIGVIVRHFTGARQEKVLSATMSYESAADEIVFVFGPVIVGILATTRGPAAPVLGAAILGMLFVTAFALHPTARVATTQPTALAAPGSPVTGSIPTASDITGPVALKSGATQAPARELLRPRLLVTVVGALGMGLFFGSTLTSLTSFMSEVGNAEAAGVIYGAMGIGSAVLALAVALLPVTFTLRWRWMLFAGILLSGTLALPFVGTIPAMGVALLITGCGVGPTLVTQYSLAAKHSPSGRSATAMSMLGSAVVVGQAAAAAVTGILADAFGTDTALLAPIAAATVVFGSGAANLALSRR